MGVDIYIIIYYYINQQRDNIMKKEYLGTINPNKIPVRVCLDNKTVLHKNKKRENYKYKGRKKVNYKQSEL